MNQLELIWLSPEAVKVIHSVQIERYGGSQGLRDSSLLESALSAAQNAWYYQPDADIFDCAACYAAKIALNHPFIDGNKRTAWAAAMEFLAVNGLDVTRSSPSLPLSDENLVAILVDRITVDKTDTRLSETFAALVIFPLIDDLNRTIGNALLKDKGFAALVGEERKAYEADFFAAGIGAGLIEARERLFIRENRLEQISQIALNLELKRTSNEWRAQFGLPVGD